MTDTELEARVKQLLADLGDDPDTIAEGLRALGIRGLPGQVEGCPIFNYLKANGVPVTRVDGIYASGEDWDVDTSGAIDEFIEAFDDNGAYPDLIEATS